MKSSLQIHVLHNLCTFLYKSIFVFGLLLVTEIVRAQGSVPPGPGSGPGAAPPGPGVTPVVGGSSLTNPLKVNSIQELLVALLGVVQVIAVPIIVFFIIYAGFLYVTARGNVEQTQKATRALMYAIIGGVIIVGAIAISLIIENLVKSF